MVPRNPLITEGQTVEAQQLCQGCCLLRPVASRVLYAALLLLGRLRCCSGVG
jgi:hypothetical protein